MRVSDFSDWMLGFVRVLGSTVVGEHGAVLWGGDGAVGDADDPLDGAGEVFTDKEALGTLGIVARPRPPEQVAGKTLGVEGLGARKGGGLIPIAVRDLRLNRRFPNPKPGSIALVGYGGGFLSFDDTGDLETRATLYVPYNFSGDTPAKAHTITVDPETESISVLHADGGQVVLLPNKQLMLISDNNTWLKLQPGEISAQATLINLIGTVVMGNPGLAVPMALGTLSPATRVFGL